MGHVWFILLGIAEREQYGSHDRVTEGTAPDHRPADRSVSRSPQGTVAHTIRVSTKNPYAFMNRSIEKPDARVHKKNYCNQ